VQFSLSIEKGEEKKGGGSGQSLDYPSDIHFNDQKKIRE